MEDRLDDAIHVLRNHAEPVVQSSLPAGASLRLTQPTSHSNELLSSTNGLTFPAGLTAAGQAIPSAVSYYCFFNQRKAPIVQKFDKERFGSGASL